MGGLILKVQKAILFSTLLMMALFLAGCSITKKQKNIEQSGIMTLKAYQAVANVTFLKDYQPNELVMEQIVNTDGTYEFLYTAPEHLKGTKLCYDGKQCKEYYPDLEQSVEYKSGDVPNELLVTSVTKRLQACDAVKKQEATLNGEKMLVYEVPIEGEYKYLSKEKLWVNLKSGAPVQLEIYDTEGNISIQIIYTQFKYNV